MFYFTDGQFFVFWISVKKKNYQKITMDLVSLLVYVKQ